MNFSKKHWKLDIQKDASMVAGIPVSTKMLYWKDKNGLSYDELAYLIKDAWTIYGKTVRDMDCSMERRRQKSSEC